MSGNGNFYSNSDYRGSSRYDPYYDRSSDSRESRGRGGHRASKGHDHCISAPRGRGRGIGRPERHYGGCREERDECDGPKNTYRDSGYRNGVRDESPCASPHDPHYREHSIRDIRFSYNSPRDISREQKRDSYRNEFLLSMSELSEDLRGGSERVRPRSTEHMAPNSNHESCPRIDERDQDCVPHRPSIRGPSRGTVYGNKRTFDSRRGPHRRSGLSSGHGSIYGSGHGAGGITPTGIPGNNGNLLGTDSMQNKSSASTYTNPWNSILKLGEGKTAGRLEQNYKELARVNNQLAELQREKIKLTCALSLLEVYGQRDAINVEMCSEKLDEFTFL